MERKEISTHANGVEIGVQTTKLRVPYRQIRAQYDKETITVYQAYNANIADAAVKAQKLNASPQFRPTRMTWVKPSWCWVNYRAGYSYKDRNQERILAIKMSHEGFLELLQTANVNHTKANLGDMTRERGTKAMNVMVQWDPERSPRLGRLGYRSIQVGIPGGLVSKWIDEWIVKIEDVTETARALKKTLDEDKVIGLKDLIARELMPQERPYEVPADLREQLRMTEDGDSGE